MKTQQSAQTHACQASGHGRLNQRLQRILNLFKSRAARQAQARREARRLREQALTERLEAWDGKGFAPNPKSKGLLIV